jgi:HEPN domain-containing protein
MKTPAEEWVQAARDDLETVKKILDDPRLTHIAAYHVQQCVEKSFKAVLEHHKQSVPNIHNLITLHGRVEAHLPTEDDVVDLDMLDRLNQLYIEARYPGEQGLLPEGKPSTEEARQFFHFADAVLDMVNQHLLERE